MPKVSFRALAWLTALALTVLTLSACQKTVPGPAAPQPKPVPTRPSAARLTTPELAQKAQQSWEEAHYSRALALYTALARRPDAPDRLDAYLNAASSALQVPDYTAALNLLAEAQGASDAAESLSDYQELYGKALLGAEQDHRFLSYFSQLAVQGDPELRTLSQSMLAEWSVTRGQYGQLASVLDPILENEPYVDEATGYPAYPGYIMERIAALPEEQLVPLLDYLAGTPLPRPDSALGLAGLGAAVGLERAGQGQYADRISAAQAQLRQALEAMENPDLRRSLARQLASALGAETTSVALALPLTGRYGSVGARVLAGARLALDRLAAQDMADLAPNLYVVNTAASGWELRLAQLPANVIGGPLLVDDFKALARNGLHKARPVFAFLQTLGELEEGRDAWRFFGSPQDQARTLLNISSQQLGLSQFGILAPDERFGRELADIFEVTAAQRGLEVTARRLYPPKDPPAWGKEVKTLLYGEEAGQTGRPMEVPLDPPFQAVFLPDGLTQARQLAPLFHLHDAEDILLLGPDLWSRPGAVIASMERSYFRLAVCPLAFDPASQAPAAEALRSQAKDAGQGAVDFWTALGYDFLRLAARLGGVDAPVDPEQVNQKLGPAQAMDYSLAPISWDEFGHASQQMMLVHPGRKGPRAVNPERLLLSLTKARERRAERVQNLRDEQEQQEQLVPQGEPQ